MYVTRSSESGKPTCGVCGNFSNHSLGNVRHHIESRHFPNTFSYTCHHCHKTVATRKALQRHLQKCASQQRLSSSLS